MDEYKKPYFVLFNSLTDIAEEIEKQNYGRAKQLIEEAQQQAEEMYISMEECDE